MSEVWLSKEDPNNEEGLFLKEILNDPEMLLWRRRQGFLPSLRIEEFIRKGQLSESHEQFYIAIPNKTVGFCSLDDVDKGHRNAEFSILIHPKSRGNGYARKGLQQLLIYGFSYLNLHRVGGEVFLHNSAAADLFISTGFRQEGIKKDVYYKNGKYISSIQLGMLEEEFRGKSWTSETLNYWTSH